MKTLLISYSNLGPQLTDALFTKLVTEGAIQKFEMWERGYQLLDCRQRYIPDEGHDLSFKNKNVFTISVCFSSGEQTTGPKHYLHRDLPVAQDVELLQVGQGGKGCQLSVTRLCKMFWVLLVTVLQ